MESERIRVLIADDLAMISDGLRMILERDGMQVVGTAATGRQARDMALELEPDVVLMNIHMPDMDGLQALAALQEARSTANVLIHTGDSRPEFMARAVGLGARGYLMKEHDPTRIPHAVRAVAAGKAIVDLELLRSALRGLSEGVPPSLGVDHRESPDLTPQELRILMLISEGLNSLAIADVLSLGIDTVNTNIESLLKKLAATDPA